jgi:hypothetical protein
MEALNTPRKVSRRLAKHAERLHVKIFPGDETQPVVKLNVDPSQYGSPQAGSPSLRPATYGYSCKSFVFWQASLAAHLGGGPGPDRGRSQPFHASKLAALPAIFADRTVMDLDPSLHTRLLWTDNNATANAMPAPILLL